MNNGAWSPSDNLHFRWIDDIPRPGSLHMAIDDYFAKNSTDIIIRFYDWKPSTVSLGYHQSSDRIDFQRLHETGLEICRRPTGGRAVVHDKVLTYSIVVPLNEEGEPTLWDLYRWVSVWWAQTLKFIFVPVELISEPLSRPGAKFDSCFASGNRYEVAVDGKKLLGSAQRRYPRAALQHGSLRMRPPRIQARDIFHACNPNEPDETTVATSLEEVMGHRVSATEIVKNLKTSFFHTFNHIAESEISDIELEKALELETLYQVKQQPSGVAA